jgi:hypothetical protein
MSKDNGMGGGQKDRPDERLDLDCYAGAMSGADAGEESESTP